MALIQKLIDPGQEIKGYRELLGINQYDFAKEVGISKPTLKRIEYGEASPRVIDLMNIYRFVAKKLSDKKEEE